MIDLTSAQAAALGLLVVRDFLPAALCAELRAAMRDAHTTRATITRRDVFDLVDERTRRTLRSEVSDDRTSEVVARLRALAPAVRRHFAVAVTGLERPHCLVYRRGDYFRAHRDTEASPAFPEVVQRRRVAVVIFLNAMAARPVVDGFCGGALTFYRLQPDPVPETCRARLQAEPGLLVAFPADLVHEVLPVTHGERHTVVSWYTAAVDAPVATRPGPV